MTFKIPLHTDIFYMAAMPFPYNAHLLCKCEYTYSFVNVFQKILLKHCHFLKFNHCLLYVSGCRFWGYRGKKVKNTNPKNCTHKNRPYIKLLIESPDPENSSLFISKLPLQNKF